MLTRALAGLWALRSFRLQVVLRIRQHTSAYVSIRQHTSAYVSIRVYSIRQHTFAYVYIGAPQLSLAGGFTSTNVLHY
jgi:hypothetical protein